MPLSVPDELKHEDQEIKRPPIIGEWFVISPTKISRTKMKLLKALGFVVIDMTEWNKSASKTDNISKNLKTIEKSNIPKWQIERMVASCVSGNLHESAPKPVNNPGAL